MSSITAPTAPSRYSSLPSTSTYNSTAPYFVSRAAAITQSNFPTRRPWEEVFALYSFTRPCTLGEATLRIKRNLNHFRVNYTMIVLFILFLSLLCYPLSLIVFFAMYIFWYFLYLRRDQPVVVFHRTIDDRVMMAMLAAVTIVTLVLTTAWLNVLVSVLMGVMVVVLHAAFRSTEDLYVDEQEVCDGGLISVVGSPITKRTVYNRI